MRLFASEKTVKLLDRMGLHDGEAIESKMVTNAIENAQKRVEQNNFGIRKHLLEYDDVMNTQRNVIYTRRRHALIGERIGTDIINTLYDCVEDVVNNYAKDDYDGFKMQVLRTFAIEPPMSEDEYRSMDDKDCVKQLFDKVLTAFQRKQERIAEVAMPFFTRVAEEQKAAGMELQGKVQVPIGDGRRLYGIVVDAKEAYESQCKALTKAWQKAVLLLTLDESWKEHLRELDQLKQSVQNAQYEQKDPLVVYKKESFLLFRSMLSEMNNKAISILMRGQIPVETNETDVKRHHDAPRRRQQFSEGRGDEPGAEQRRVASAPQGPQRPTMPIRNAGPKVGRNDPCPCGSGKKFKDCHGR